MAFWFFCVLTAKIEHSRVGQETQRTDITTQYLGKRRLCNIGLYAWFTDILITFQNVSRILWLEPTSELNNTSQTRKAVISNFPKSPVVTFK